MKNLLTKKIFDVTNRLIRHGAPISIRELSEKSGVERNACWRIVSDLCELGYLRKVTYRTVEPGLGMVFLGQAAYSDAFFPNRAVQELTRTARELKIGTALAGIFNDQLVYLYRDRENPQEVFHCPLSRSNLALCILGYRYGAQYALKRMKRDMIALGMKSDEIKRKSADFNVRLAGLARNGYALEKNLSGCNISFPLERDREIFGLAFFFPHETPHDLNTLIIRCSLLRNTLQGFSC